MIFGISVGRPKTLILKLDPLVRPSWTLLAEFVDEFVVSKPNEGNGHLFSKYTTPIYSLRMCKGFWNRLELRLLFVLHVFDSMPIFMTHFEQKVNLMCLI